jgi:hypothetical protein
VTDLGKKLDGGSHHLFSGEMLLDRAPIMTHGVVHVHGQFVFSTSRLEFEFSFDNSGTMAAKMVLIEFLFSGKYIKGPKFGPRENMVTTALFVAIVVFVFGGTSPPGFA